METDTQHTHILFYKIYAIKWRKSISIGELLSLNSFYQWTLKSYAGFGPANGVAVLFVDILQINSDNEKQVHHKQK